MILYVLCKFAASTAVTCVTFLLPWARPCLIFGIFWHKFYKLFKKKMPKIIFINCNLYQDVETNKMPLHPKGNY